MLRKINNVLDVLHLRRALTALVLIFFVWHFAFAHFHVICNGCPSAVNETSSGCGHCDDCKGVDAPPAVQSDDLCEHHTHDPAGHHHGDDCSKGMTISPLQISAQTLRVIDDIPLPPLWFHFASSGAERHAGGRVSGIDPPPIPIDLIPQHLIGRASTVLRL